MVKEKAFTLIELLIASSILVIVMITIFSAFHSGIFGYRNINEIIETYQAARVILERADLDLRNSFAYKDNNNKTKFMGNGQEISFLTLADTFSQKEFIREFTFVSYKLEDNKLFRFCRRAEDALNDKSETRPEEMADNVALTFQYGRISKDENTGKPEVEFIDTWPDPDRPADEQESLPAAVKLKLIINPVRDGVSGQGIPNAVKEKIEQEFERTVYLPHA